jgi:hypothetical protein
VFHSSLHDRVPLFVSTGPGDIAATFLDIGRLQRICHIGCDPFVITMTEREGGT